eukprot:gnl/TRDRNA2_/TRDRNA2_148720_c2_seq4.p1 gnl/TRDRNA2_/TRDRNA2_148720_c2~~gnl/TRDRNA2_/TRDRNA2_148720_c2_seq4.p1  ORF type:complete len:358 (-),score=51.31 gnl/TRDRNA2_/TRDRNA2_148720_c2_seq4:167-1240(-)
MASTFSRVPIHEPAEMPPDEEEEKPERFAMPQDMWGEMVLSIIDIWDREAVAEKRHSEGKNMDLFCLMSFAIWILTISVLLGFTYSLYATLLEDAEDPFEVGLTEKTAELLAAANARNSTLLSARAAKLCAAQGVRHLTAYTLCVALFSMKALAEVMNAIHFLNVVFCMSSHHQLEDDDRPLKEQIMHAIESSDGHSPKKHDIVALPGCLKYVIAFVGPLPRVLIAFWLWIIGIKYMFLAPDTATLVLTTMAVAWLFMIDELFFSNFITKSRQEKVQHTQFLFFPIKALNHDSNWAQAGSVFFRLVVVFGVALLTQYIIYGDLSDFRRACQSYYQEMTLPEELKVAPNKGLSSTFFG